ncbi:MAG: transcription termination/antitermination factor NusG [Candidatus Riflebacteria bacterium RBG_13_59_9]|nr:MAG: transcription termination/antitermination factor NusG [Candidatus Riflebacteria bacterium RBG_13_59_9]
MRWYVLHTMSGCEDKVAQTLRHMLENAQLDENIEEVVVPHELRLESVKGKKRTIPRKMYPGYVLARMNLTNENRLILKQVQGVIGFIGSPDAPQPLSEEEVRAIFARMESEDPVLETSYKVNDTVKVLSGPFAEAIGKVREIDAEKRKVKIMISLFGRDTQLELDFDQVESFEPEELATDTS